MTYNSEKDIKPLLDAFEDAGVDEVDGDNGLDLSIHGLAYEYVYTKEGEPVPASKNLSPLNTFMVHDDTIEENELFAVYYYARRMILTMNLHRTWQQYVPGIISM